MPIANSTPRLETRVRSRDADTSWAAAEITPGALSTLKINICHILRDKGPLTDDEIHDEYRRRVLAKTPGYFPRSPVRVRTARHEMTVLTNPPLVKVESHDGRSAYNRPSQVWAFIPISDRRLHEYERAVTPDKEHSEYVCAACGEWTCPIADASVDVPEVRK